MNNLTEDIRSDLTKIFSERNEVVAEEEHDNRVWYEVTVRETSSEVVEVSANSPEEAKEKAIALAENGDITWTSREYDAGNVYEVDDLPSDVNYSDSKSSEYKHNIR